jgi:hypothetical protein
LRQLETGLTKREILLNVVLASYTVKFEELQAIVELIAALLSLKKLRRRRTLDQSQKWAVSAAIQVGIGGQ